MRRTRVASANANWPGASGLRGGRWGSSGPAARSAVVMKGFSSIERNTTSRNCPVGVARAPGFTNLDAVLSKRFAIGGPRYAELRIEAFNVLNHPSFGPPARDISVPNTFGTITSTISSPRVVELVFKFYF